MPILSGLKRLIVSFQSYKQAMEWYAKLQAEGLVKFDPEKQGAVLSHRIPEELMGDSFRAAEAYSMTYLYLAKAAEYTRIGCICLFAYIGYQVFLG